MMGWDDESDGRVIWAGRRFCPGGLGAAIDWS